MNERHELKMHGHEPEAWPQKTPTPISLWLAYVVGNYTLLVYASGCTTAAFGSR